MIGRVLYFAENPTFLLWVDRKRSLKLLLAHAKDDFWPDYVKMMTNLKRGVIEDSRTGARKAVWIVTGGAKLDHRRHAGAYCMLAAERVGLAKSVER